MEMVCRSESLENSYKGGCRSGQTGRVKGALAYAYEGSNPSPPIRIK